jgi:hypothetical protein
LSNDAGVCGAVATFATPTFGDNCPGATIASSPLVSGDVFPVGTTLTTFTVTDASGNTASCSFSVTVNDVEAPVAVCQNVTVQLDAAGNGSTTAAAVDGGSTDNCGVTGISATPLSFTCANVGANTVTLTVTDAAGNTNSCTATATVEDNVAPNAVCAAYTAQLDASGNASITASNVDGGSTDACGIASLAVSPSAFTCAEVGANTVTLTVTDVNGNTSTCTATVTVEDNVPPVAVCQDVTVQLDAAGNGSITTGDVDGGSTDACGIANLAVSPSTFTCANVGANTSTLTVTDVNGNTATCTSNVTVEDNIPPVALCQDLTIQLDAAGNASITDADVNAGSTDACGIATTTIDISTFACANVGSGNTVTLTVTDVNGNVSTCTSTVTVEDNVAPDAVCAAYTAN